nr:MAG TPA: hypothetical protein [Caudoviricetes sp.]
MLDLTKYAPYEPLTLKIGDWEITSPVPNTRTGLLIQKFLERVGAEAAGTAQDEIEIDGWPETNEELSKMLLGEAEYERLANSDCPAPFIFLATQAALIYWSNGGNEAAVELFMAHAFQTEDNGPKAQ